MDNNEIEKSVFHRILCRRIYKISRNMQVNITVVTAIFNFKKNEKSMRLQLFSEQESKETCLFRL